MEKEQFQHILRDELIARGMTPEGAERHVRTLSLSFEPKDLKEIAHLRVEDIAPIAEGIAKVRDRVAQAKKEASAPKSLPFDTPPKADTAVDTPSEADTDEEQKDGTAEGMFSLLSLEELLEDDTKNYTPAAADAAPKASSPKEESDEEVLRIFEPSSTNAAYDEDDDVKVYTGERAAPDPAAFAEETSQEEENPPPLEEISPEEEAPPAAQIQATKRGRTVFWTVLLCTLPITISLLLAYYVLFAVAFTALCALIIALFAALIGGVAIGTTVALTGIIYGIVQLITALSPAPGLYEIGLGLTVAGCVMLGGILVYNCAIRFIPWLIKKLGVFFRFCSRKLKQLLKKAKEACYTL